MPTFPNDRVFRSHNITLYLDKNLQQKAALFDASSGQLIPASQLVVGPDGLLPLFTCNAQVLYGRNETGNVVAFYPAPTLAAPSTITGTRGTGSAISSLISALNAVGFNFTDGTSA